MKFMMEKKNRKHFNFTEDERIFTIRDYVYMQQIFGLWSD